MRNVVFALIILSALSCTSCRVDHKRNEVDKSESGKIEDMTKVSMTDFSSNSNLSWANLKANELTIIRSTNELIAFLDNDSNIPEIDFNNYTLLAVNLYMPTLIIHTNQVYKEDDSGDYLYYIEVELSDATMIGEKTLATLIPFIPESEQVGLKIDIKN